MKPELPKHLQQAIDEARVLLKRTLPECVETFNALVRSLENIPGRLQAYELAITARRSSRAERSGPPIHKATSARGRKKQLARSRKCSH